MPALHDLQVQMLGALLSSDAAPAVPLVAAPPAIALARLHVYRNTVRANFMGSLKSTYPALFRLVGEEYFRQLARQFQLRHPSRSGDLLNVGAQFPTHLAELHGNDEYRYLADVARLEWLIQDTLLAAEHAPFDLEKMAGIAPAAYDTLRFELHPALRLFESGFPALRIWEANTGDAEPEPIDLHEGADRLVLLREQGQLRCHRVSLAEYRFLDECGNGAPFAGAVEAASDAAAADSAPGASEFDAALALRRFVALEAIVDCRVELDR